MLLSLNIEVFMIKKLTDRESQILTLIAEGMSNKLTKNCLFTDDSRHLEYFQRARIFLLVADG